MYIAILSHSEINVFWSKLLMISQALEHFGLHNKVGGQGGKGGGGHNWFPCKGTGKQYGNFLLPTS